MICKCCGQEMPTEYGFQLPPGYRVLFETVRKAGPLGIRADRLFTKIYSGPDGGPLCGRKSITTRIFFLNQRYLKQHGLKIRGENTGSRDYGRYRLGVV